LCTSLLTHAGKPFASRTAHSSPLSGSALPSLPGYRNIDARLTPDQRADALTWTAYISGTLTDLIYHSLYSLPPNYAFLAGAQTAALPFPLAHYVPHRLRGIHAARLRSVGLWGLGGEVEETATSGESVLDDTVIAPGGTKAPRAWAGWRAGREAADRKRVFGQEKVRVRARTALEPIARQLGEGAYFFGNR
jgi:sorting and assembly machinery component 37